MSVGGDLLLKTVISILFLGVAGNLDLPHCLWPSNSGECEFCQRGWYGTNCDLKCVGHCDIGGCDRNTGRCLLCYHGYYSDECELVCPSSCGTSYDGNVYCDRYTGNCLEGCKPRWWGVKCRKLCSVNCTNQECLFLDGTCSSGCMKGTTGALCQNTCPITCLNNICEQWHEQCTEGCPSGYYGTRCNNICNENCFHNECYYNETTGIVICARDCIPGTDECILNVCQQWDGTCINGCKVGYHGKHCNISCSNTCIDSKCTYINTADTVVCLEGCIPGKMSASCDQDCPDNCYSSSCEQMTGKCRGCKIGYHGSHCNVSCSKTCIDSKCTSVNTVDNVICLQGCTPGKMSASCDQDCPDNCTSCDQTTGQCQTCEEGFWGQACSSLCSDQCFKQTCDMEGDCHSCVQGTHGARCDQKCPEGCPYCLQADGSCKETSSIKTVLKASTSENPMNTVIGVIVGTFFVILLLVFILLKNKKLRCIPKVPITKSRDIAADVASNEVLLKSSLSFGSNTSGRRSEDEDAGD